MRIKMLRSVAGPGFAYAKKREAEVPDVLGADLIAAGHAVALASRKPIVEDAKTPKAEEAVLPASSAKRRRS